MPENPLEHLKALIERYTVISFVPDIDRYRRIATPKGGPVHIPRLSRTHRLGGCTGRQLPLRGALPGR